MISEYLILVLMSALMPSAGASASSQSAVLAMGNTSCSVSSGSERWARACWTHFIALMSFTTWPVGMLDDVRPRPWR